MVITRDEIKNNIKVYKKKTILSKYSNENIFMLY